MEAAPTVEKLREAGLARGSQKPVLTPRGREWLRAMEELETEEIADSGGAADDLIVSTSGLFR
jgi:hypothetical protein